jgi:hypothetical protein
MVHALFPQLGILLVIDIFAGSERCSFTTWQLKRESKWPPLIWLICAK